jgi:hypothetical protein
VLASSIFGLKTVIEIYGQASRETQLIVIVASALWAAGTLLFGKGVEMSGVALGVGLGKFFVHIPILPFAVFAECVVAELGLSQSFRACPVPGGS